MHGLHELGWHLPYDTIKHMAEAAAYAVPDYAGIVKWLVTAGLDGVLGLALGVLIIPLATWVIGPIWGVIFKGKA